MSRTIAIHSSKGGTGKTSLALNLAGSYVSSGKKVCLMDMDSKGPSLHSFFNVTPNNYFNEYLRGAISIHETLTNIDLDRSGQKGELYVAFSDPEIGAIREFSTMDRKWQTKILKRLINAKKDLEGLGIDIIILDTSPGVEFGSVNAVAVSDFVLVTVKPNKICIQSIEQVINGIYRMLGKECAIIENMCPESKDHYCSLSNTNLEVPVLESILCRCDIATLVCKEIITLQRPEHPYSKSVFRIRDKLDSHLNLD